MRSVVLSAPGRSFLLPSTSSGMPAQASKKQKPSACRPVLAWIVLYCCGLQHHSIITHIAAAIHYISKLPLLPPGCLVQWYPLHAERAAGCLGAPDSEGLDSSSCSSARALSSESWSAASTTYTTACTPRQ